MNFWVGAVPAIFMSFELHRVPELFGILFGQDWDLFDTGVKRFQYFAYEEVELIPVRYDIIWSDLLGSFTWRRAKEKCDSIGMVLPTREDFYKAYYAGITKSWNPKDGYWTSEITDAGYTSTPYIFEVGSNGINENRLESFGKELPTRCISR